jgi:hypothetical protein
VVLPKPAAAVTLAPDTGNPSPHIAGSPVIFTATATGSSGYEYLFNLWQGSTRVASQAWSTSATWTMPADQAPGTYGVQVLVRTSQSVAYDAFANVTYEVVPRPAASVTLAPTPGNESPHVAGTAVVFAATATGSSGYEYLFNLWLGNTRVATQPWSSSPTWTMAADQAPGRYGVQVLVRTNRSVPYDVFANVPYDVIPRPATGVALSPDAENPSPHVAGTPVVFTAIAAGSSGYEFAFNLWLGNTRVAEQPWSTNSQWTMRGDQPPGDYVVQVLVRTNPSRSYDAFANVPYQLIP